MEEVKHGLVEPQELSEEEVRRGLWLVIKDGMASQAMATLTGGAFLTAFALALGASNFLIGLLSAIPLFAQFLQLPALFLIGPLKRRSICVWASGIGRSAWLAAALVPLFAPKEVALKVLVGAVAFQAAFAAVSNASWNSWMRDLVPEKEFGRFFSRRMALTTALAVILALLGGFFVDQWQRWFPGRGLGAYCFLYFCGFLLGFWGLKYLSQIPEPPLRLGRESPGAFRSLLGPLRDENFRRLLRFYGLWSFAMNFASPFFVVYMVLWLKMSMALIVALGVLGQFVGLVFLPIWGRLSDAMANKSVLRISVPLYALSLIAWTFTTLPEPHAMTVPLLVGIYVAVGVSQAGVTLAASNISLKLSPKGAAAPYLAAYNVLGSILGGMASVLGGVVADALKGYSFGFFFEVSSPTRQYLQPLLHFKDLDFLFLLASLMGFMSLRELSRVKEEGELEKGLFVDLLLEEVKRPIKELIPREGLKNFLGVLTVSQRREKGG